MNSEERKPTNLKKYQSLWGQLNNETKKHSLRVASLCTELAPQLKLDAEIAYKIGYLHDIGKIYLPSRILKKNCKLTKIEREIIDLHSYIGFMLLKDLEESNLICLSVLYHHGFNKHLLKTINDDPDNQHAFVYFSLIHVVDIYDARTNKRHYQNLASDEEIFNDLSKDWLCTPRVLAALREYVSKQNESNIGDSCL